MALTPKQQQFAAEYTVDFNGSAAAIRAGYSEKTARNIASMLLNKPEIQQAVQEEIKKRQERTQTDGDYVIQKLREIADMTAADFTDSKLRFSNKIRALELLGKHLGLFDPKAGTDKPDRDDDPLTASLKEWMTKNGDG